MDQQTTMNSSPDDITGEEGQAMLAALRRALKGAGWTQLKLAEEFGVASATMKRWLHGRGLSFQTLERLCRFADITIADLAQESHVAERERNQLTLAQEKALTEDSGLSTVFFLIVNDWPPSEATEYFNIPPDDVERHVKRLERLALVDRRPGGRVRARLDPAYVWRRAPMRRHFDRVMKPYFLSMDFGRADAVFGVETIKLSPLGLARLRERIEQFRTELRVMARQDRFGTVLPADWYAVLAVARPMKPVLFPEDQSSD